MHPLSVEQVGSHSAAGFRYLWKPFVSEMLAALFSRFKLPLFELDLFA